MRASWRRCTKRHPGARPLCRPFPPQGVKLTRATSLSEDLRGCNNAAPLIISALRGDLVSRPVVVVRARLKSWPRPASRNARHLADTSAYGIDVMFQPGIGRSARCAQVLDQARNWEARPVGAPPLRLPLPAGLGGHPAVAREHPSLSGSPSSTPRRGAEDMRRRPMAKKTLERLHAWRETCPDLGRALHFFVGFPGETEEISRCCSTGSTKPGSTGPVLQVRAVRERAPTSSGSNRCRRGQGSPLHRFMSARRRFRRPRLAGRSAAPARHHRTRRTEPRPGAGPDMTRRRSTARAHPVAAAAARRRDRHRQIDRSDAYGPIRPGGYRACLRKWSRLGMKTA